MSSCRARFAHSGYYSLPCPHAADLSGNLPTVVDETAFREDETRTVPVSRRGLHLASRHPVAVFIGSGSGDSRRGG